MLCADDFAPDCDGAARRRLGKRGQVCGEGTRRVAASPSLLLGLLLSRGVGAQHSVAHDDDAVARLHADNPFYGRAHASANDIEIGIVNQGRENRQQFLVQLGNRRHGVFPLFAKFYALADGISKRIQDTAHIGDLVPDEVKPFLICGRLGHPLQTPVEAGQTLFEDRARPRLLLIALSARQCRCRRDQFGASSRGGLEPEHADRSP